MIEQCLVCDGPADYESHHNLVGLVRCHDAECGAAFVMYAVAADEDPTEKSVKVVGLLWPLKSEE